MSSHHFVREGQEPTLFIFSYAEQQQEIIAQLLEWNPVLATTIECVSQLVAQGIKIDVVCCPIHKKDQLEELLIHQWPIKVLYTELNLESCIQSIISDGNTMLNVFCEVIDINQLPVCQLGIVYYDYSYRYFITDKKIEKWMVANTEIFLNDIEGLSTNGLIKEAGNCYKVLNDGIVVIASNHRICLGEKYLA